MIETFSELMEYLGDRGAKYGISAFEIYETIPENVRDPESAYEYMQMKDISHKVPLSKGGDPAGDNWILEDSDVNRARGAENMSPEEEEAARQDAQDDANSISGKQLLKAAVLGGALTSGGAVVEGAVAVGQLAAGGAVAAAEATFITTVVVPTVVTTALVGGAGWLGYKLIQKFS